jgi:tetratricopeptide (TPR) repeat protein
MRHHRSSCALFVFMFLVLFAGAQRTAFYTDDDRLYKDGVEMFDKKQYVTAQKLFNSYTARPNSPILLVADAKFYEAACGIELFNKDGEWLMREFIRVYPWSMRINEAWFYLANSSFRKKKYDDAIENFEKIDLYRLDKDQLAELYFKRGYSHLQLNNPEKAKADFFEIKDVDNKYSYPATYYHSHITYKEKNYDAALTGFNKLLGNQTFGGLAPYYITQIYFMQGKYADVVKEAPKLLKDSANVQKEQEINRMIGESYFNLKDFGKALEYLQKTNVNTPQGNYALGFCYYKINDCQKALQYFERATTGMDSLAQNAWYHMGDCHLKLKDKLKAKNAFYSAYQLGRDEKIKEDALFSFAKLSYELDFSPYNEAVKSFSRYLKEYPNSPRKDEVYTFLINVYSTTKNYDQAIKSMESLESIDPVLKVTYQKLIYFKGIEYFNNNDFDNADIQFKKSFAQNSDPRLNALNLYWLGEVAYVKHDYTNAIAIWKKFQVTDGSLSLQEYDLSNYALGYAYFQRKESGDYGEANVAFRKFLLSTNKYDEKKIADANIRAADCYFMNRDFAQASEYYKKAIALNKVDMDYSIYQKALCDGLNKNYNEKISELRRIESRYPGSHYLSAALNELADTYYRNLKDYENAIAYYEKILKNYPNSSFTNNALAQLGNIYYERKEDTKAFQYYDRFVQRDSKSDAAKDVLEAIKKIFEAKGDVEGMEKYFAAVGNPLSENQLEKASYTAAYDAFYTRKNCEEAMPKWEAYINKFPNGRHITEAHFSFAECAYNKGQFDKALEHYNFIVNQDRSIYSETALSKASYLYFKDKKYEEALPLFQKLQEFAETPANKTAGRLGAMRCAFQLKKYDVALEESTKVINTEKLSPQQLAEARYIKAKSLFETQNYDQALTEFTAITKSAKNVTGAEAWYHISKIHFDRKQYKDVEKSISKLMGYEYSNDEWNNKGLLLQIDAYIANGETADARVLLETMLEAKPKQEYLDEAQKRLTELDAKESEQKQDNKGSELKLQFNQSKRDSALFDSK